MTKPDSDQTTRQRLGRPAVSLGQYIRRRNGLPPGAAGSLRSMLQRSLGAGSFAGFWQHWNPVFGYYLGWYVYAPLRRLLPASASVVVTFVVCGALHDLVTMAVRGSSAFLFTPWFLFLGLGVVLGRVVGMDLSSRPWVVRAAVNVGYIVVCLLATLVMKRYLAPI